MRKTSAADLEPSPTRSIYRPALLERVLLLVPRPRAAHLGHPGGQSRRRLVGASFGVGFACGGLLGSAALLALLTHPRPAWTQQVLVPAKAPEPAGADALPPSGLEMPIRRSRDGKAPFPLHVTGADGADGIRVVLSDLPEPVRLSSGERRDEHTWDLRLADLEDLHVTLGEGTPDTFDVTIEVASAAGFAVAQTVARVRLAGRSESAPALSPSAVATIEDLLRQPVAPPRARAAAPALRAEARSVPRVEEHAAAPSPRPLLPEGITSLGGPNRDGPSGPAAGVEDRKLWWRVPAPTTGWAPFADRASGN